MTPDLWKMLIGAVVLFLTAGAGLLKVWTELAKVKAERAEVGAKREADSQALHEQVQKLTWENARLKEDLMVVKTHIDDHQLQLSNIVTEIAKLGVKMDTVIEGLNKLQEDK